MQSLQIETMNHGGQSNLEKLSYPQSINFEDMLSKQDFEFKTKTRFQESLERINGFFSLKKLGIFFSVLIILFIILKYMNNSTQSDEIQTKTQTKVHSDSILRLSERQQNSHQKEVQETLDSMSVFATDGSTYPQVWLALKNKVSQFIIFIRSENDVNNKVEAQFGPWGADFSNFTSLIHEGQQQVGFVYLGNSSGMQLYLVVYAPSQTSLTPAQVLINFGLPTDAASLTSFGIQAPLIFVMTDLSQLTSSNIISQATSSVVSSL